jgi:PIN domain-containing protein
LILDTGALVAAERNDRRFWTFYKLAQQRGIIATVPTPVVAEAWRGGGPRQALLARVLGGCTCAPPDETVAKRAGDLLAATGGSNTIDALVVAHAEHLRQEIITGDPDDLGLLAEYADSVTVRSLRN